MIVLIGVETWGMAHRQPSMLNWRVKVVSIFELQKVFSTNFIEFFVKKDKIFLDLVNFGKFCGKYGE